MNARAQKERDNDTETETQRQRERGEERETEREHAKYMSTPSLTDLQFRTRALFASHINYPTVDVEIAKLKCPQNSYDHY